MPAGPSPSCDPLKWPPARAGGLWSRHLDAAAGRPGRTRRSGPRGWCPAGGAGVMRVIRPRSPRPECRCGKVRLALVEFAGLPRGAVPSADRAVLGRVPRAVRKGRSLVLVRLRERVTDAGPAQEDPLHPGDPRRLPAGLDRSRRPTSTSRSVNQCREPGASGDAPGLYSMIQLFSGGALLQLAIFALGIMPYITASIILQLLTVVIPRLEALKKEGAVRHRRRSPSTPATSPWCWPC